MDKDVVMYVAGAIFAVLWYLLRQKDAVQAAQIQLLFKKHDDDYEALQVVKLQLASQHYVKGELDTKFDKLEGAFKDGLDSLGKKFDHLSDVLIERVK